MWGRLVTCGGLVIRLVLFQENCKGRFGRRLPICPTKEVLFVVRTWRGNRRRCAIPALSGNTRLRK